MPIAQTMIAAVALIAWTTTMATASPEVWKRQGWKTDFTKHSIEWREVLSGGPPRDGIPSIDHPKFAAAAGLRGINDNEPVIGLEIDGDARAYPLRILTWHEIVNDVVAGKPVTVTFCPLCNAAIVFDRVLDGQTLDFGTSGMLRNSDLIMYDRQSHSWWQQFTGQSIAGTHTGKELRMIPARLESFARFKARFPKGKVLVPNNPNLRNYGRNPYVGYDTAAAPFLFSGELPKGIAAMARVIVIENGGEPTAVSMALLRSKGRMTLGGTVLTWEKGQTSALDGPVIASGRDIGNVVAQRKGADGVLKDVRYDVTFAFVYHAFHPKSAIVQR